MQPHSPPVLVYIVMKSFQDIISIIGILAMHTATAGETPSGIENAGLRMRLAVKTDRVKAVDRHDITIEIRNVTTNPVTLQAGWPYEENAGDFRDYLKEAVTFVATPEIGPWEGQIMGPNRTSAQPEYVLTPDAPLILQWQTTGRNLKLKENRALDMRTQPLPTDGLYSVHALVAVGTRDETVTLVSNEQDVPIGGSREPPKHPLGRIVRVAADERVATIDIGSAQKIAKGDQFIVRTGMTDFWRLTIQHVFEEEAGGKLEPADAWGRDFEATPRLPTPGTLARLITKDAQDKPPNGTTP